MCKGRNLFGSLNADETTQKQSICLRENPRLCECLEVPGGESLEILAPRIFGQLGTVRGVLTFGLKQETAYGCVLFSVWI